MLAALHSCRAEINSTPDCTSACDTLKFAVPKSPKQRRAPYWARSAAITPATVGLPFILVPCLADVRKIQALQHRIAQRAGVRKAQTGKPRPLHRAKITLQT